MFELVKFSDEVVGELDKQKMSVGFKSNTHFYIIICMSLIFWAVFG